MADPIIVDCGGSTRVRRLVPGGIGEMNTLLDVAENPPQPPQSSHDAKGQFSQATIVFIDLNGGHTVGPFPLANGSSFQVASQNGQTVQGSIDTTGAGKSTIKLLGTPGNPPLVEAKQLGGKRRYVVINAGPIQTITVNNVVQFDLGATPSLYTTLVLT